MKLPKTQIKKLARGAMTLGVLSGTALMSALPASAANVTGLKVTLGDSRPSQASTYKVDFAAGTTGSVGCIELRFTTTATGSTVPAAMTTTTATLGSETLVGSGWAVASAVDGTVQVTNASAQSFVSGVAQDFTLATITNSSSATTQYMKISTYATDACNTTVVDTAVGAYKIENGVQVSATIDPTLSFAVTTLAAGAQYKAVDFASNGAVTVDCGASNSALTYPASMIYSSAYTCGQQMVTSTNGTGGYVVTVHGNHTTGYFLKAEGAAGREIDDSDGTNGTPTDTNMGNSDNSFGYTTDDATLSGGTPGRFNTADRWAKVPQSDETHDEIAYNNAAGTETVKLGYRLKFGDTKAAGKYTGTLVYVASATF
jgi:hypothetical protein